MYLSKLTDYILHLQQVIFVIELVSFEKFRETWDMWLVLKGQGTRSLKDQKDFHLFSSSTQIYLRHPSPRSEEEKIDFATARKEVGTRLFKEGRYPLAMERYKKIVDLFSYIESFKVRQMNLFFFLVWKRHTSFTNFFSGQIVGIVCSPSLLLRNFICTWDHDAHTWQDDENKAKAKELKKVCKLNRAACQLKLKLFSEAKASCDTVLKDDAHNVKALFRRAQAHFGLKSFMECTFDVKKVLELEPQNREARALAKEVQKAQKEEDQKSKGMFGKMCQALGTGPIREPYVDRRFDFDEEERLQKEASKEWLKSHWVELTILLSGSMGELSMLRD